MRTLTVVLDADYTPRSISYLATLATAIPQIADADSANPTSHDGRKLRSRHLWLRVYAESGNNAGDATHDPARIGFEGTDVTASFLTSNVILTAHGTLLTPGLYADFPSAGPVGLYDFRTTAISGKTGDIFQIHYGPL